MSIYDEDFKTKMEFYLELLNEDDLMPFRKHEKLPSVLALNLLNNMRKDIAEMKGQIIEAYFIIQQLELLDKLDEEINRNIQGLIG